MERGWYYNTIPTRQEGKRRESQLLSQGLFDSLPSARPSSSPSGSASFSATLTAPLPSRSFSNPALDVVDELTDDSDESEPERGGTRSGGLVGKDEGREAYGSCSKVELDDDTDPCDGRLGGVGGRRAPDRGAGLVGPPYEVDSAQPRSRSFIASSSSSTIARRRCLRMCCL